MHCSNPLAALLHLVVLFAACEPSPQTQPLAEEPVQPHTSTAGAVKPKVAVRPLKVAKLATFENVGSDWVSGGEPWYSVGAGQKLWKWEKSKPTELSGVHVRNHFATTQNPDLLAIDSKLFAVTKEVGFTSVPKAVHKPWGLFSKRGFGTSEAMWTPDLGLLVASMRFRPPRGMPTKGPDGKKTYRYAGPRKPRGASNFVAVLDAATGEERFRMDGAGRSLASSSRHVGFLIGSKIVLVSRETWASTEFDVSESIAYLAMNESSLVVAGRGDKVLSYRVHDDGHLDEVARWDVVPEAVSFLALHPSRQVVAIGYRKGAFVDIWDPAASTEKATLIIAEAHRAHFLAGGERLVVSDADGEGTRLFSLD